jgi:hypothetical protein
MPSGTTLIRRLALAALVSGATAGLLATLSILLAMLIGGRGAWKAPAPGDLAVLLADGFGAGLIVASLPAFVGGAAMCALGRRFDYARRAPAWAAAGAGAGLVLWAVAATAVRIRVGEPGLARADGALLAAGLGAGAALAFRAVARPAGGPI